MRAAAVIGFLVAAAITFLLIWFNVTTISEALSPGPPYYGLTTNLDKWPGWTPLILSDLTYSALAFALFLFSRLLWRRSVGKPLIK